MKRMKSLGDGLVILSILLGTAVITIIWPLFSPSLMSMGGGPSPFGGATRPSTSPTPIAITIPEPVASMVGMNELVWPGFVAFAVLAAIVIGSVVIAGLIITFLMRLGGRFTSQVAENEDYKAHVAALVAKDKEQTKASQVKQPAMDKPETYVYSLDPISYSLVILFFVALLGTLIYALTSPTGEITLFGQTFNSVLPILLILLVITIPVLAWRVRRSRLDAIADNDNGPIPWDFIAVLITGLLVLGVGIGLMLFFSTSV